MLRRTPLDRMSHDEISDEVWDNPVLHPSTHVLSNQGFLLCTQSSFTSRGLFITFPLPTHILLRILWVGFLDESQDFVLWCKTKNKLWYFTQKDYWFLNICIHAVKLSLIMQVSVNQGQVSEVHHYRGTVKSHVLKVCFPSPPVYGMWHPVRKPVWSHLNSQQDCFILISSCLYIYGANPITRYFIFEFVASSFWFARFLTRVNWNSLGMCKLYATSQLCPGAVAVSSKEHVSTGSRHWLACDTSLHQ